MRRRSSSSAQDCRLSWRLLSCSLDPRVAGLAIGHPPRLAPRGACSDQVRGDFAACTASEVVDTDKRLGFPGRAAVHVPPLGIGADVDPLLPVGPHKLAGLEVI